MHAYLLYSKLPFLNQAFCDYANLKGNEVHPITESKSTLLNEVLKKEKIDFFGPENLGNFYN